MSTLGTLVLVLVAFHAGVIVTWIVAELRSAFEGGRTVVTPEIVVPIDRTSDDPWFAYPGPVPPF